MATVSNENIWSSMIAARQLSITYYTLSTCLTDLLHRYHENYSLSQTNTMSSSLFHNLDQTLFSTTSNTNPSKLFDEYSNILQNILKQNSLHTNIIQNVRRLFRFDSCLKELFTTEVNEQCQCHECDCTISNSIIDVIHDVSDIRTTLLNASSQVSCICSRCGDQNQHKTLTFKQSSSCLALTVDRLNINATDQLTNPQGIVYDLIYIIELDSTSRSISNVYLRQNTEFVKVDGNDLSTRSTIFNSQGRFLTLWLGNRSTPMTDSSQPTTTVSQSHTFLSPPQSASSSSSQLVSNSQTNNEISVPLPEHCCSYFDDVLIPSNSSFDPDSGGGDDDQFWNSFTEQITPITSENMSTTTTNDSVSDLYLTLLHSTKNDSSATQSRAEYDRTVNTLASNILLPLILDHTKRPKEKKTSSSSTTTTIPSLSSNSSTTSSTHRRNRLYNNPHRL